MDLECAFENVRVPGQLRGIDLIVSKLNIAINSCNALSFITYNFPRAERKRTLDGENISANYKPQIYLKSKEWFNLLPDDTVKAFSFFYTNSPKNNFSDDKINWTQTINLVVWANLSLIDPTEDSIFKENLIQQVQQIIIDNQFYDTIEGVVNIYDDFDSTWTDFDIINEDYARFIKGNTTTFRIEFDVRGTTETCLC
jgi:hypothetical protein